MTMAPPENDAVVRPVVRQRSAQQRRRRRRLVGAQALVTLLFVGAAVGLGWFGWNTALRITGGPTSEVTDPNAPGYVAAVKPTSVSLVAFTTVPDGALATMVMVIERSGDPDLTLVPLPANLALWDFEESGPDLASNIFASGGIDVLRLRLGAQLGFGLTQAVTGPVTSLGDLLGPVGPVTLSLPDEVLAGTSIEDATVRYPAGELTLEPSEIPEFLSTAGFDESESNRALRLEVFWDAVASTVSDAGVDLAGTAGDDTGLSLVADSLGSSVRVESVPLQPMPLNLEPPGYLYRIDPAGMPAWTAAEVPFPTSAYPGQRARVELLNGTRGDTALQAVAPRIVEVNGEVAYTGNAESFELTESRVEYANAGAQSVADDIAAALGLRATRTEQVPANVDVVVVVGSDQLAGTGG